MICVNNKGIVSGLTVGRHYNILRVINGSLCAGMPGIDYIDYSGVWVINDNNKKEYYTRKRFVDVPTWREKQLNELI